MLSPGERFGRLTVLEVCGVNSEGKRLYRCRCDCGNTTISTSQHLKSGNTKSCGCLRSDRARDRHLQHGGKGTRLYNIWKNARQRCRNPKNPDYRLYGARGVTFSAEWDDFGKFRDWSLANGYTEELTLDRINPDGNYEPGNCRWATWLEQRHNQRRCKGVVK